MARVYADGVTQPVSQGDAANLIGEVPIRFDSDGAQGAPVEMFALTPKSERGEYAMIRVGFKAMTVKDGNATLLLKSTSKFSDPEECFPSKPDTSNAVNGGIQNLLTQGIDNPPGGDKFDAASFLAGAKE